MELLFIDNNTPLDRQAQRIVRSHAMTSKNLGRTISGRGLRGRQGRIEPLPSQFNAIKHTSNAQGTGRLILPKLTYRDSDAVHTEKLTVPRTPFSGTEWSYFSTPVTLTSWDRSLIYECMRSFVANKLGTRVTNNIADSQSITSLASSSTLLNFAVNPMKPICPGSSV